MSDLQRVEELTLKLLDDQLSPAEQDELEQLIAFGGAAAELHLGLMEQEAALRGSRKNFDLTDATMQRLGQKQSARIEAAVMDKIRDKQPAYQPIEPAWAWLWSKKFWKFSAAAATFVLIALGLHTWWIANRLADPQEAYLYGQAQITPGTKSPQRVFVRNGRTAEPIAQAKVELAVYSPDDKPVWTVSAKTDQSGIVLIEPELEADLPEGDYQIRVVASSAHGQSKLQRKLALKRSYRVLVTTDKPLYQPGQLIHIRALALSTIDMRPAAEREIVIEVKDAKGNKVFKKKLKTSRFGITAADFELADQVNTGEYLVSAGMGDTLSERSLTVKRYRLPKFRTDLTAQRGYYAPGEILGGSLSAQYTFGEPVANARVEITASEYIGKFKSFAKVAGRTDSAGNFEFSIPLKDYFAGQALKKGDAFVTLEATVTDNAQHTQKKNLELIVTRQPIRIEMFPESGQLVQNVENVLYILTAYPDGRPAQTRLTIGNTNQRLETSPVGIGKVKITPKKSDLQLTVRAEDSQGTRVEVTRKLRVNERSDAFLLRTDRAVYATGATANLSVHAPGISGVVFVDVVKDQRTLLTKSLPIKNGLGQLALDLPADIFGTLELHAYRIMRDGNISADAKVIQVKRAADLEITAELDKSTYRPAEKAVLKLAVKRANGDPVQAALGLAGVDEAVFALHEMRPGLARVYFMLQEEILKPRFEIHAHLPLSAQQSIEPGRLEKPELEEASVVLFSAAKGSAPPAKKASMTFGEKNSRYRQAERQHYSDLTGLAALLPILFFLLLTIPLVGYAVWRLFKPADLPALEDHESAALKKSMLWLSVWWAGLFYLPLASLILSSFVLRRHRMELGVFIAIIAGVAALIKLTIWVFRLWKNPAAASYPLFRKLICGLPVAGLLAYGGGLCIIFANKIHPRGLSDFSAAFFGISMAALFLLCIGAIGAAGARLLKKVSSLRMLGIFAGRTALAALPILILPLFFIGGMAKAPVAFALKADAAQAKASQRPGDTEATSSASLKAPTRVRRHFPETLLWQPELITDADGKASLEIPLADSITTWRIAMNAVSAKGELGSGALPLRVFQDFFVDIDFPVTLTQHDKVTVPIAIYNYLDHRQIVRLEVVKQAWFKSNLAGEFPVPFKIGPKQVSSMGFTFEVLKPGRHTLTIKAYGSHMADAVERRVIVEPDGQAVVQTISGRLDENLNREFVVPVEAIAGADDLFVKIYPGSFSQVVEGLDSIFQMPSGCFEQTSSATYPNVLVLNYMRQTKQIKPEIEMKALNFINLGYQRLLSFEVSGGGFEWFGKAPAHTVLTAYGLMEFSDMAKVFEVEPAVIERTREWLFDQQKDDGTWEPPQGGIAEGAINQYQGKKLRTTAYIAWAMAESAASDKLDRRLQIALDYIADQAGSEKDAYCLAVCANALVAGKHKDARRILTLLGQQKKVKDKLVNWSSSSEGVTHSKGNVLDIETTALAAYAFLQAKHDIPTAHRALAWLVQNKDSFGNWHSTQATVHAFRALLLGAGTGAEVKDKLQVTVAANGKVARELVITKDNADVFHLISLCDLIKRGKNMVALETSGQGSLAYQIVATHYLPWKKEKIAAKKPKKRMSVAVDYDSTSLKSNDRLQCKVTVSYNLEGVANMTIIDLGIPPGFSAEPGTFETLKDNNIIERFSITGRQVILYIREIPHSKPLSFVYQLKAKYPVKVQAPPTKVYQYYQPEIRDETKPVKLTVL